jgi:hypothetical protein
MKLLFNRTILALLFIVVLAFHANAASFSAIDIQKDFVRAASHDNKAEATIDINVTLPDYPDIKPINFYSNIIVPYTRSHKSISIDSSSVPLLLSELKDIPHAMRPLTIGMKIENNNIRAAWDDKKEFQVSDIDIKVMIFKKQLWQVSETSIPTLEFTLNDTSMVIENIDFDDQLIWITFSEPLPKTDNELFNKLAAGKIIDGFVTIEINDF